MPLIPDLHGRWRVAPVPVDHPEAADLLRRYFTEIVSRYHRRIANAEEIDAAMTEDPSADLVPPGGLFLLASRGDVVAGCAGLRLLAPETAEIKRLFVRADARRLGGGSFLLAAAERSATDLGATTMRLDTRHDLVEARRLYGAHGYVEVPPYADARYADHWFEKPLPNRP